MQKQNQGSGAVNTEVFERLPVPKALMKLAVPTIIGQLIILIYNMADTFYIGRANNPLMVGGASLILPVFNITIALAGVAGIGGGSLISRLLGAGKAEEAKKVSSFSFWFTITIAAMFSIGVAINMNPLLKLLGASENTINYARQYATCVLVFGGIPTVMSMTLSNLLRSTGNAKEAGFGVSMGGILNILLDPLFMFVLLPDGMQMVGAGTATALSNCIVCLYYFIFLRRQHGNTVLSFSPKAGMPSKKQIGSVFSVGVPSALSTLLFDLDYIIIDMLAAGYGDIPLAAIGVVLKIERIPLNVGVGLCQGMTPIAAYNYASGNFRRMKDVVNYSRIVGLIVAAFSIILYETLAPSIIRLFINDAMTVQIGGNFLRARVLATPFMFLCFHIVHFFQATGNGKRSLFLAVVRWAVFNIPMLFILNHLMGMYGIVWAQGTSDILMAILSLIIYFRFVRKLIENRESTPAPQAAG